MVTKAKKIEASKEIEVKPIRVGKLDVCVIGRSPFICNRLSEKARRELLMPRGGRKTAADKAASLKHDPYAEFRDSPYTLHEQDAPTLLAVPVGAFKGAISDVALDVGGASKAQIGRLTWVDGYDLPLFGIPEIFCSVVRNSDQNHTPDVRTRAILPQWATTFSVNYVEPNLRAQNIADLLTNSGFICGVGDWRQQKGSGSFGQFEIVLPTDKRFLEIVRTGGRVAQIKAMGNPRAHNAETEELLEWFGIELRRRGYTTPNELAAEPVPAAVMAAAAPVRRRRRSNGATEEPQ